MQTAYARKMIKIRSKTVEPVLGTLINFLNMKRVNTRGIKQANKHVMMAELCYNLLFYKSHFFQNLLVLRTFKIFFIIKNREVQKVSLR